MSTQADKIVCVRTVCTVAWVASSSPAIGERAGAGRGWRIDGDGGWLKNEEDRGLGCGPDLVLAVMKEKQTDLTVTNEPSPLPQLPVLFLSNSSLTLSLSPTPPPVSFQAPSTPVFFIFTYQALFFSLTFPRPTFFILLLFSLWCSFTSLPLTILFLALLLEKYWRFLCLKRSCYSLLCSHFSVLFSLFNR